MVPDPLGEIVTVLAGLVGVVGVLALTLFGPVIILIYAGSLPEPVTDVIRSFPVWVTLPAVVALPFGAAFGFLVCLSRAEPFPDWL